MMRAFARALAAADAAYAVEIADTPELLREAYRLRYQVYCRERRFEACDGDEEVDPFDDHAPHVVLRQTGCRTVIGTARLVLPKGGLSGLPVHQLCDPGVLRHLPSRSTGEVSRFAISKERRPMSDDAAGLMRLALISGLVRLSSEERVTHWCAVMERSLLRLLRSTAIWFNPMGPVVEHHGLRQPCYIAVDDMLARIGSELPALYDYLTGNGRWWRVPEPLRLVA